MPTIGVRHPARLEQGHPFRQWKTWTIPGTTLTITGYSRANDKTFFHIPGLKCCLDAGLCEGRQPETVFLTHTHHDHSRDIDFLASRSAGVDLYAPAEALGYVETAIRSTRELNFMAPFDPALAGALRLHGVRGGDRIMLGKHAVRVVECVHKIPCVGYCFSEVKSRLTPELEKLKLEMTAQGRHKELGTLLAQQRKAGVEINESFEQPLFAFLGDTHARVFEQTPWLFDYPVIITECTYLDDKERDRADRVGHTLWSQLRPVIETHPDHLFVLIHFSLRYSDAEVLAFFEKTGLHNLVIWAHPESLLPEQHQHET
ncbi:MAG: MBL fold metallo-hydrolase [Kofleriaceae bacterium]